MTTAMLALLHRDVRVARRELHYFLLRVAIQPLLFTFIFGYVMPQLGIVQRAYTSMLLPGILGLSMTLSSMQAVALPLVIDFGWSKEIEDRLLAPISIGFTVLLTPMIFFGCAYSPWATLHIIPWFQYSVLVNPLVYASEGFRLALTPELPHMPAWLVYGGLLGFSLFFTWVGLRKF